MQIKSYNAHNIHITTHNVQHVTNDIHKITTLGDFEMNVILDRL